MESVKYELLQISSSWFCVGVELQNDKVHWTPPLVKYMTGWPRKKVISYANRRGWKVKIVRSI